MVLEFSGIKRDDVAIGPTQENAKAASERARELEEKNAILNKIGEASKIIDVIGDQVKDVSFNLCLVTFAELIHPLVTPCHGSARGCSQTLHKSRHLKRVPIHHLSSF